MDKQSIADEVLRLLNRAEEIYFVNREKHLADRKKEDEWLEKYTDISFPETNQKIILPFFFEFQIDGYVCRTAQYIEIEIFNKAQ